MNISQCNVCPLPASRCPNIHNWGLGFIGFIGFTGFIGFVGSVGFIGFQRRTGLNDATAYYEPAVET